MSSRWLTRLGDTERFAIELAFEHDPDQGAGATEEHSQSWGSFQLWIEGKNLCAHEELGEHIESVHWYLLPLLEWWVQNWDPMLHEQRLPRREVVGTDACSALRQNSWPPLGLSDDEGDAWLDDWQAWWRRHSLQAAREGGLFPDIFIRRLGHEVEVSWGQGKLAGAPHHYRFLHAAGSAKLTPASIAEPLAEVLGSAISTLRGWLPESSRLKQLQQAYAGLRSPSAVRIAWLAGLPLAAWRRFAEHARQKFEPAQNALESIFDQGDDALVIDGSCQAAIMFGTLSPTIEEGDLLAVAGEQIRSFADSYREVDQLQKLTLSTPLGPDPAYHQGYELAQAVLDDLGLDSGDGPVDIENILQGFGIRIEAVRLSDESIRGLAFVSPNHQPTILVNESHPANEHRSGQRFTLAHELAHLLNDRTRGRGLALASGPWTSLGIEQRANAFAAMLLMPPQRVRRFLEAQGPERSRQQVGQLAKRLETGFMATLQHLSNLGFLSPAQRDAIEAQID